MYSQVVQAWKQHYDAFCELKLDQTVHNVEGAKEEKVCSVCLFPLLFLAFLAMPMGITKLDFALPT